MKQGWEIKKLGDIAKFYRGLTYSKGDEVPSSTNMVLRSNNVDLETNALVYDDMKCLREDLLVDEDKKVKANSILICMSNGSKQHIGKVAYIQDNIDYAFGGFMGLIVPTKDIEGKYLYYSCVSHHFKHFLAGIGNGIGITNLRFSDLSSYCFPVPPLAEQEKIVAELDCLSGIIEKKKQQLKELDNLAQSIFYEMFGDPVENDKGWEVKTYGSEFQISSGGTPDTKNNLYWDNGDISWIGSNLCHDEIIYKNDGKYITKDGFDNSSAKEYKSGYVLVALVGATIGRTALLRFNTTTNQNVAGINVPANENFVPEFIFYHLQKLYELFMGIGNGKFKMANLRFIRELPLIVPSLSLQQDFASKIESIEKQKELIAQSIKETETLFNSRMDYYFN